MFDPGDETPQYTSMSGCFLRIVWAMFGPTVVLISSLIIIASKSSYGSWPDFVLLGAALASVAARYFDPGVVDHSRNDGDIGMVTPHRYLVWILVAAAIVLVLAHSVAPLLR